MNGRARRNPETNRNGLPIALLAISLLCLIFLSWPIGAEPVDGSHQTPSQSGQTQNFTRLEIDQNNYLVTCNILIGNSSYFPDFTGCQLPNDYGLGLSYRFEAQRVLLGTTLLKPLTIIRGNVYVAVSAYYANNIDLSQYIVSHRHEIQPGASILIHSPVTISGTTTFIFRAPEGVSAYDGMGRIRILGALSANNAVGQIDILGTTTQLPITLITYTQISGTWRAGVIPPGTQVEITPRAIRLIRSKKR